MATNIKSLSPSGVVVSSLTVNLTFTLDDGFTASGFQIKYKRVIDSDWNSTGLIAGSFTGTKTYAITCQKNMVYFWKVRVWDSAGNMMDWTSPVAFAVQIPAVGVLKVAKLSGSVPLRVVDIGQSEQPSNVRISLSSGIKELDLTSPGSVADSGVRIATKSGIIKAVAKPIEVPGSVYNDHTNSGYLAYVDHTDTGYAAYDDWVNTGYGKYSDHTNTGYGKYSDHTNSGYSVYSDHTNTGYTKYSVYNVPKRL